MPRSKITPVIYLSTATACSLFMLGRNADAGGRWSAFLLIWLLVAAVPLLFLFAYSRFLFAESTSRGQRKVAAIVSGLGGILATTLFSFLATPFWKNPVRNLGDSMVYLLVAIAVLAIFLVAAVFLLLSKQSSLAIVAAILFWPYWLVLALIFVDRWFQDSGIHAAYYFLCFAAPVLFTAAAGAALRRSFVAHVLALAGIIGAPFLYSDVVKGNGYDNVWLLFNQPDNRFAVYPLYTVPAILSVALLALAFSTAVERLLPARWHIGKYSLRDQTWPGLIVCFVVMAIWFSRSVMPYRIPGAVDYSDYPVLQILHVEKHGLQFHERCFNVYWLRPYRPISVSFSSSDRRLFQYRFQEKGASLQPPPALVERIQEIVKSSAHGARQWDVVKPLWNWNAEGWYFFLQGSCLRAYGTATGTAPPHEVVDLFQQLNDVPRTGESGSGLKDVCLGFCYDPRSAMGSLYSNHRCFNDGHGVVCR